MSCSRPSPLWLFGFLLASCGGHTITISTDGGARTTGSGGAVGIGGTGGSSITGGAGGASITGGVGGASITGGAGGFAAAGGTGGIVGSGGTTCATPIDCPCTRRPGMGNCFVCPTGAGESQASLITARAGGSLLLTAQQGAGIPFWATVPAMAVTTDVTVTVTETTIAPPGDYVDYSPVYVFDPLMATSLPIKLVVPYSNKGDVPTDLAIYFASDPSGPFARVDDSRDNSGFIEGTVSAFGALFVGSPKTAAQMTCP